MKSPMLPICLAFAIGIAVADTFLLPTMVWWCIAFTGFVVVLQFFLQSNANPTLATLRLLPFTTLFLPLLTCLSCGMLLTLVQQNVQKVAYPNDYGHYDIVIASEPKTNNKSFTADAIITSGLYAGRNARLAFDKSCFKEGSFSVGDGFEVNCRLREPMDIYTSNFSYSRYLRVRDIPFVAFIGKNRCKGKAVQLDSLSFFQRSRLGALKLRHRILDKYRDFGVTGESLSIVAAMTLGDKSMLTPMLRDTYSISGASHILALSGTHLVIVFFLFSLLFRHYSRRWYGMGIMLSLTWAYVILVGMPSSVVRSALMLTIFSIAQTAGRGTNSINSLATTSFIMMVLNPQVLFDASFQLSVIAVASILFSTQFTSRKSNKPALLTRKSIRIVKKLPLTSIITIPLSAQIATAPLVAFYFGRLPVYFLITNIVVIPATSVILYLSATCIILFPIPMLGSTMAWLLKTTITYFNVCLTAIASLPHSSVEIPSMTPIKVALCYAFMIAIITYMQLKLGEHVNNNKINRIG
ncbi:MAG: ComEC/Rec2 family competence protein [Prevotella sp.]